MNVMFCNTQRSIEEPTEQEKQLHELVFGKDIIAATSERQQSASVQVRLSCHS